MTEEKLDRRRMALQMASVLCFIAAFVQLFGGNLLFLISAVAYAISGVGLVQQSRSRSFWGARAARICAAVNGAVNVLTVAYALLYVTGDNEPTRAAVNYLLLLIVNLLIFWGAKWGSGPGPKPTQKNIGIF